MNTKKYISGALALATVAGMSFALPLFADTSATASLNGQVSSRMMGQRGQGVGRGGVNMMRPTIMGTVASISGNILTVTVKRFTKPVVGSPSGTAPTATTVTYTVDVTNATVTKAGVASTVSAIAIGDTISAQGTLTGSNVVATSIRDGVMPRGQESGGKAGGSANANAGINLVAGNGQPIVGGAITAISTDGLTLTITNKSNVIYIVGITGSTKFLQGSTTIAISGVKIGDQVVVQGTVNGTNIVASTVIDQTKPAGITTTNPGKHVGFFGGIGQFFAHLFGF